jgi:hypothetical protein
MHGALQRSGDWTGPIVAEQNTSRRDDLTHINPVSRSHSDRNVRFVRNVSIGPTPKVTARVVVLGLNQARKAYDLVNRAS